jgi:Transglutaminase-like superfamily
MVHRLLTFARLPAADRVLAVRAAGWLVAVRVALWTLPFARVQELVERLGARRGTVGVAPGRLAWTVETTARSIPQATCLTQALAAQVMLSRAGESPELHIGVATDRGAFEAHAWLELHGRPLVGDRELDRYARLESGG